MKLVLLSDRIPPEHAGGAERVAWSLAVDLHDSGHDVHVITTTADKPFTETRQGIHTYHLHAAYPDRWSAWMGVRNPQTLGPLAELLHELRPDALNAHNVHRYLSWSSLTAAHKLDIPVIFTAHDMMAVAYGKLTHFINPTQRAIPTTFDYKLPPDANLRMAHLRYNPLRNRQIRRILSQSGAICVCVSEAQRQALAQNGLDGFRVVYNGVDVERFQPPQSAIERMRARLDGRPTILFAGRLSAEKGSKLLLDALEKILQSLPTAQLFILGNPGRTQAMLDSRPGLSKAIQVGGWLDGSDLSAAYHAADVVAVPSIFLEALGMVALEGMAAAKPIVASCFGGLPEVVIDNETGYIVNPFDTDALADRLLRLLTDPSLAQRLGSAGQNRVQTHFTLSQQVRAMETLFSEAVSTGSSAG